MSARMSAVMSAAVSVAMSAVLQSQEPTVIVYRLGRDTAAIEQYTRTNNRLTGEMVSRTGAAVVRTTYDYALKGGKVTSMVMKRFGADGNPLPNQPLEWRFALNGKGDTIVREVIWKDSTSKRYYVSPNAFVVTPVFAYGPMEIVAAMGKGKRDSLPTVTFGGANLGYVGFTTLGGDTLRMRGGPYDMVMVFDKNNRLQSVDGLNTTNKAMGTRAAGRVDIAALVSTLKPSGVLSPRQLAGVTISQSPIFISYGSPSVRGRTVWGGTLVPLDSIWRTGANEATHLATGKTLQLGDLTLAPGLYTLWTQHTRNGTWLIVNKQVGQWGTQYNAANDVGRVQLELKDAPSFAEELQIAVRSLGQGRGAIDIAWGDKVATAPFTVR